MARGPSGSLARFLIVALVVGACAAAPIAESSTTSTLAATTTSAPTTTTTAAPTTTTTQATTTTTLAEMPDIDAVVRTPDGEGPFPAVVLVHGGGWVAGEPALMSTLQTLLTDEGFLTVNIRYKLSIDSPGFPDALSDVACAVNHARAMPDSDGTVAVVGHSAGAHLSAVVALTGDEYAGECPVAGDGTPDKLVGLAGPYDVERLGLLMFPFFGAGPSAEPEAWAAGNPQSLTDENPDLISLIMYGDEDGIVEDRFAIDFHNALVDAGVESTLELVEGARHMNMRQPEWVGDLIVVWLER